MKNSNMAEIHTNVYDCKIVVNQASIRVSGDSLPPPPPPPPKPNPPQHPPPTTSRAELIVFPFKKSYRGVVKVFPPPPPKNRNSYLRQSVSQGRPGSWLLFQVKTSVSLNW